MYTPDCWTIIEFKRPDAEVFYKVYAGWYGGFAYGDSWKLNSGIESFEEKDDVVTFVGASGSKYCCHRAQENHGTMWLTNVMWQLIEEFEKLTEGKAQVISFDLFKEEFKAK